LYPLFLLGKGEGREKEFTVQLTEEKKGCSNSFTTHEKQACGKERASAMSGGRKEGGELTLSMMTQGGRKECASEVSVFH